MAGDNKTTFDALRLLSESISSSVRNLLRSENERALNQLADSFRSITPPIDGVSQVLKEIVQNYKVPQLPDFLPRQLFSDYLSSQLSSFSFSEMAGTSELVKSFQTAFINTDYQACVSALSEALASSTISTYDFSFLKTLDISREFLSAINGPTGLLTSLNNLNKETAYRLAREEDITYDIEKAAFVVKNNPSAIATAKEMNVITSGADLFDCMEDEYISESELMNFMSYLQSSPTFAAVNSVGKKIYDLLERFAEHLSFDCNQYYHSRARENGARPFTFDEMLTAPSGVTGPGRYNHPGQAFYYFADTEEGAEAEVRKHNAGKTIQTAIIKPNKSINMIDLSGTIRHGQTFLKYIRFDATDGVMPKAYLIPCFVSDCCRSLHIDGIKYYGTKAYSNYVCWNAGYFDFVSMI